MKQKLLLLIIGLMFTLTIFPSITNAHNGGRDELGGHFRSSDCVYLLHDPTPLAKSAKDLNELITLIKQNNANAKCVSKLSEDTIDLEGYTFSGSSSTAAPSTPTAPAPAAPALEVGNRYTATLDKCVDGDTANFVVDGQAYKTRFLYIDTPEYTTQKEPFGKEASEFTCSFLEKGTITLETDGKDLFDKYDRLLAWVWVGDQLHQEEITKAGLVEDFYDYGDYKHEQTIITAMDYAKSNYTGIYAANKPAETPKEEEKKEVAVNTKTGTTDEDKEETKVEEKTEVASSEVMTPEEEEAGNGYFITGLIISLLFFMIPRIKYSMGVQPLLAHRLRTRKWLINLFLFFLYVAFWWIILIVVIIELIHLVKKRRRYA